MSSFAWASSAAENGEPKAAQAPDWMSKARASEAVSVMARQSPAPRAGQS